MQRASLAASFHTNAPTAAPIEIPMLALFRSMKPTARSGAFNDGSDVSNAS